MNLLEMNDGILYGKKKVVKIPEITANDLSLFKKTILISEYVRRTYESVDDSNSFFALYPDIKQIVGAKKCVECFYADKLGYYMKGVSMKLVYILNKACKECGCEFPNLTLNSVVNLLKPYVSCIFVNNGKEYTLKDVIENVFGKPVKLINTSVTKISYSDCAEVYIPNANRVAILPIDIANTISHEDCEKLYYDNNLGIMLRDIPVRTLGNRLGITKNDFDLRESV